MNKSFDIKRLVGMAVFAALAFGVTFVFRIPVAFLTFDAKDAVLTVASFIYGPVAAVLMSLVAALLELITISGTGLYGFIMNFCSSACFSAVSALIYKYHRNINGAILGLYASVVATTALMMGLNLLVTPFYTGTDVGTVAGMIPTLLLPFNFAKALMNSAIAMLIYKPITMAMRRARLIPGKMEVTFNKKSLIMLIVGALTLVAAIIIFVILKSK